MRKAEAITQMILNLVLGPIREEIGLPPKQVYDTPEMEEILGFIRGIPQAQDGVRCIPNVHDIFILPWTFNWMGADDDEVMSYTGFDKDDEEIYYGPLRVRKWVHHGDHIWFILEGEEEGHWWDGPYYSNADSAIQSLPGSVREKVKPLSMRPT